MCKFFKTMTQFGGLGLASKLMKGDKPERDPADVVVPGDAGAAAQMGRSFRFNRPLQ